MAIFGKIIDPTNQAVLEYWKNLENGSNIPKLQWQVTPFKLPKVVGKFFIFEGKSLWDGVRAKNTIVEVNCVKEANLHLYRSQNALHFIAVVKDCDLSMNVGVVRVLQDLITRAKMVVTVQEKPLSEFQTKLTITTPQTLRKIVTTNKSNLMKENVSKLELPNIITGVSAGVFSLRERLGLCATSMVIFMQPQEKQVDDIENLMQKMSMSGAAQVSPNAV